MRKTKYLAGLTFSFLFILFLTSGTTEETGVIWYTDFDKAVEAATEDDKTVMISFQGSDWCANCMRLERTLFESAAFGAYASENLVLLKLDFPARKKNQLSEAQQKHNDALAEVYNKNGIFPTVIFLNKEKTILGELSHPSSTVEEYMANIKSVIGE